MKMRALINILVCYILMSLAGVSNLGADTNPVSVNVVGGIDAFVRINDDWDGYVNTINHGAETVLEFRRYFTNSYDRKALIKFDLTQQIGLTVTSAKLALYFYYVPSAFGSRTVALSRVTSPWDEMTVTAANLPSIDSTVIASNVVSYTKLGWYTWDITDLVRGWMSNPSTNNGVVLYVTGDSYIWYNANAYSSNYTGDVALRPTLTLQGISSVIQPPQLIPTPPSVTNSSTLALSGTKAANTAIVVNGTTIYQLDGQPTWQGTYTLQPGMNNLNISAMDANGFNSQAVTISVALDLTAPTVTSTNPVNNGLLNTSVLSITFNLSDAYSNLDLAATVNSATVRNASGSDVLGTWTTSGSGLIGSVTFTPDPPVSALADGTYTAISNPTDTLGNQSTNSITFTVDTTPPQLPSIDPILLPSRTATKTITGTKSLDSVKVIAACEGATMGIVSYPTSSTWSSVVSGLHEGSNTITAYAVDAATNSSFSTQMTFTVDTISPSQPIVNSPVTPTKQSSITLTGSKEANSYLFVNNVKTAETYTDTAWSYAANLASEGNNAFVLFAQDEAGNPSTSVTVNVVRDTTGPRISTTTPSFNAIVNQLASVDIGLVDDNSSVNLLASYLDAEVKHSSGTVIPGSWAGQNGHIIFTPDMGTVLSDGLYTVTIKPVDVLGNIITLSFNFTLDATAPTAQSATMNPTSPHKAESVTFVLTFNEDMQTTVQPSVVITGGATSATYPLSGSWTANPKIWQGSYTFTTGTGDGSYLIRISGAKDRAQNLMTPNDATTFLLDTTTPAVPMVAAVASPTKNTTVTLTGTKEANSYVYVNNIKNAALYSDVTWSYSSTLTEGNNSFTIYAKDEAGNQSQTLPVTVVRDTAPPAIASSTPTANTFVNAAATITVVLNDLYSTVDLQACANTAIVTNTVTNTVASGSWALNGGSLVFTPDPPLTSSRYTVALTAQDSLGNAGPVSFSFTLDSAAPTVQSVTMNLISPHTAETVQFTITFSEDMLTTAQPSVVITGGAANATYPLSGSWTSNPKIWQGSYIFTMGTGDGTYTLKVTGAKDKAQNTIPDYTATDLFVLDTTAPAAPTVNAVTTPTKIANQVLSGTKEANTAIIINNNLKVNLDANTMWSCSYLLSEDTNTLSVVSRDAAGNDSSSANPKPVIVLDTTPPQFTINTYPNPCSSPTVTLSGKKEPGCVVKLNNTQIIGPDDASQTWSYSVTLVSGITNHFVFTAADALSNTTTKTADILYDNAPPAALGQGVLTADGSGKGNEVTLSWAAYQETSDVSYYAVYKSSSAFTDVAGMTPIGTANKGVKTYKVTGLSLGITYYFAVVPVDSAGNKTSAVNIASAIPTDTVAPEEVTNLAATAGYSGAQGNTIALTWTASVNSIGDLADQFVYFDSGTGYDNGISIGKTVATYSKTGLTDATKYKFKITVKDTLGHESQGVVIEAVTRLANPANLTGAPGSGKVVLTWNAVSSPYVKQYNVYRKASTTQQTDVGAMTLVKSVTGSTTYTDTGLTNDTTYQYAVTVLNTSGAERTDVQSTSATPRSDSTGPVIKTFNIIAGQIITAPITISATALDAESAMGSLELSVDGTVVATQSGGSISFFWNAVASTDGNHTIKIKALDSLGNATEDPRQVIVSLAPPAIPAITGHVVSQTTPTYIVTVSGTAPLFTTVTLKVNGTVVNTTQTAGATGTGTFSFSSIALTEGDNFLAVKASNRGGESAYAPDYKITVDTGAPSSPQNLTAQVLTGGLVRFTWANGTGEVPAGYNLYVGTSSFTSTSGATKTNTTPITYLLKEYNPVDDGLKYYAVTAVDSAGNESAISNVVAVSSDRAFPSVLGIQYSQNSQAIAPNAAVGKGSVNVDVTVSEKLSELPFFSLEPQEGTPIVVSMIRVDDTHYTGSFVITDQSPQGPTTYKFSGKDMVGNRGNAQGTGVTIDVQGPVAAVQSPLTTLQITTNPVAVTLVLNEPSTTTPVLGLLATTGTTAMVSGMTSTDNGIHWSGMIDVSGMPEGKAEFVFTAAQDSLGNIGSTVSSGRHILLYLNGIAPPGIPEGLAAKAEKAGAVTLTWYPVTNPNPGLSTVTYSLYRRAEGETSATRSQTGITGNMTQDVPPADGLYYYSVTSVGLLASESPASADVQAVSDRVGPPAPANLSLSLTGGGMSAMWDVVVDTDSGLSLKGYNLYRSNGLISSATGLTPIVKSAINTTVDTSPSRSYRFYAVAAVDSLGNEGPLSDTVDIDFPVSPVRNLVFQRIDNAAPTITWQAPVDSGSIAGYYIYRNRSRIVNYPVPNLSYSDGYYTGGTIYGISAVDTLGNESPISEVSVPELTLGINDGTILRRGLLETIPIIISNAGSGVQGSGSLTIDSVDVKVGTAPISSIQGPFYLGANTTLQLEKVAATTADASSPVAVFIQANWSPSPGVSVKVSRTVAVEVAGSSSSLEIFNDPVVRNTDAKVRLKVNNIGSAQMEIVTSENNTKTTKVRVNLKDQDGNILSTGYLDQRIGNAIVNGAGYAVARINPNESFTTEPISVLVPATVPAAVIIEAMIESTYYHYGKTDQVVAPGMKGTAATTIHDTPYRAVAAPDKTFYAMAQPVVISGSAISNDPATSGQLVPNVPVKLGISVNGFDRYFTITTDATGNFNYTFTPGSNEAGSYSLWAVHPDVKDRTVQATFSIAGIAINPTWANVRLARNRSLDIPVTISNYGGGSLTGLTFQKTSSGGITTGIINTGDITLNAGEKQAITWRLTADGTAPDTGSATLQVTTAEGLSVTLNASITMVSLIPIISTSPSYIDTGMMRGDQKIATFTITNTGEDTLRNARIEGPSASWIGLTQNKALGDLAPGASIPIGFMFSPPANLAQGVYDDQVVIYSDNHMPYTYHIQVTISSNAVGSVYFTIQNILAERVPNATITLQHQLLRDLIYTVKTGTDGTVMKDDIPEGRYVFTVSPPPGHLPYSGTFVISPGTTTTSSIILEVKLVDVTWSVVPTTIQDKYEIKITQTFATNVPLPVLVTEPAVINIPEMQPGQVFNGEFTITNYGLIAAVNMKATFPTSILDYDVEVFTAALPSRIGAQQKVTLPFKVTRRQAVTAALGQGSWDAGTILLSALNNSNSKLFNEVQGYGAACGSASAPIGASGQAESCPVAGTTVTVSTNGYIVISPNCGTGGSGGGGSGGGSSGGSGWSGGYATGTGLSGGGTPGATGNIPTGSCECMHCDDYNDCTTDACSEGTCFNVPIVCPPSDPCNISTGCNPTGGGCGSIPKDCDDHDPCTDDSCGPGGCVNTPINCDDGNSCTNDSCGPGGCSHNAIDCDDHDGCTVDSCEGGGCQHVSIDNVPNDPTDCVTRRCVNGQIVTDPADGENPPQGPTDDCKRNICMGGHSVAVDDNTEIPANPCKMCYNGGQINRPDCTNACNNSNMRCYAGNCTLNNPIADLDQCPNRVDNPNAGKTSNGCSVPPWIEFLFGADGDNPMGGPNSSFRPACDWHDRCYGTCWSLKVTDCDYTFAAYLHNICDDAYPGLVNSFSAGQCHAYASAYGLMVTEFGYFKYMQGQRDGCNCCP